jgi:hypothetical protein
MPKEAEEKMQRDLISGAYLIPRNDSGEVREERASVGIGLSPAS